MNTTELSRFLKTCSYLRPSQVAWRLRYAMQRRLPNRSQRYELPAYRAVRLRRDFPRVPLTGPHVAPNGMVEKLSAGNIRLLNREDRLGFQTPDWRLGRTVSHRLWTITLHYHEWIYRLAEIAATDAPQSYQASSLFKHFLSDWLLNVDVDRVGARDLAWNAYATATRITWWIRAYYTMPVSFWSVEGELEEAFLKGLWKQAAYLHEHLEYDLLANHILRDAVGLAWAGRFFDAPEARIWLRTATRIAVKQSREQVLADGGHFERSPMYHKHAMDDLLSLTHVLEDSQVSTELQRTWERMAVCASWLQHPDGDIPLLNDAALMDSSAHNGTSGNGRSRQRKDVASKAKGGRLFPNFGLMAWHGDPWTIFFDVGPVGVDYQPGHGHADSLTVEASFRGHRLWVDPGTWGYDHDDRRKYDRSTSAHNTICVDERNSSDVWHIFRCGRRARPMKVTAEVGERTFTAMAGHDGYRYLPGNPQLTRTITLHPDQRLEIADQCDGQGTHRISGGWLLAPGWTAEPCDRGWTISRQGCGRLRITIDGPPDLRLGQSPCWYHPEFGVEVVTTRLEWSVQTTLPMHVLTVQEPE